MNRKLKGNALVVLSLLMFFAALFLWESHALARAGRGGSSGSRGSRSFSSPRTPSSSGSPSYSPGSSGRGYASGTPSRGGSSFMSGMAGGFFGGMIGNMMFGRPGYGGGGMGLLDLIILVLIFSWAWRFIKKRRPDIFEGRGDGQQNFESYDMPPQEPVRYAEVEEGLQRFRMTDPGFSEEALKEKFQDIFFRVQAAWMNRTLDGIYGLLAPEMVAYFGEQFKEMKTQGRINRLENIAIRKVEFTEIWQEEGLDYVTALITANLLDYTEDERTGQVVSGDRMNPVKFEEFWTFCRSLGSSDWELAAINQVGQAPR